jgi:hypothetical protein
MNRHGPPHPAQGQGMGGFLCIDMEQYKYKEITIELYKRLRSAPEFRDYPHLGIVFQCYLRCTDVDVSELLAWARKENNCPSRSAWSRAPTGTTKP